MDRVFAALASASRRRMLDLVKDRPGCSLREISESFDMSRIAVMKHLRVLEEAGLLITEKVGRTRRHYFNAVPIQMIHDRWTSKYGALWATRMTEIKYRVEKREREDELARRARKKARKKGVPRRGTRKKSTRKKSTRKKTGPARRGRKT